MQIFHVLYFTFIAYLLAVTIPESQGRWLALCQGTLSLISYIRLTASATILPYRLAIVTNPLPAEKSFPSMGKNDVCWLSPFGIYGICHPLDTPSTPTPTVVLNTPATRTSSAIAASPIGYKLTLYEDTFFARPNTKNAPRKSKGYKSRQGGIPSNVESIGPLDLLSTITSTMIIVQFLMVRRVDDPSLH